MSELFTEKQIEEYSLALLRWAYGKLGSHSAAEELAQEVWLQVYRSARAAEENGTPIQLPEHYLWRVAHHVWCRHLRSNMSSYRCVPIDDLPVAQEDADHAQRHADEEEKEYFLQKLRRKLMELNRLQREIMIRFYIEGQSQKKIAQALDTSVSAVKWHLFDTRQKLKEDMLHMENNEFVYRPRKLHLYISGEAHDFSNINAVNASLSKQNICIACYEKAQTAEMLSRMLGIPLVYVESDLQWLLEKEMVQKNGNAYRTAFLIENGFQEQERYAVYLKLKNVLSDVIVQGLMEAEEKIRKIGFHGSDQPMSKLLWLLIYRFADGLMAEDKAAAPPIRVDGGRYHVCGFDMEQPSEKVLDTSHWSWNGAMSCPNGFRWFGMESFGYAEPIKLFELAAGEWKRLQDMLVNVIAGKVSVDQLNDEERFDLSALIEKNFVKMEGEKVVPTFCTFTSEEYRRLKVNVFWPLARRLEQARNALDEELNALCRRQVPEHLSHLLPAAVRMARYNLSLLTTFFAYQDGYLYRPQSEKDGAMLTLMYIKPE